MQLPFTIPALPFLLVAGSYQPSGGATLTPATGQIRFSVFVLGILYTLLLFSACADPEPIPLQDGLVIREDAIIEPGAYFFPGRDSLDEPVVIIEGDNITVDFAGAEMVGSNTTDRPDTFKGVAVWVRNGSNVTIRNLKARGYKIALLATDVDSLRLLNADLSYNYRPRLYSVRERENLVDWLSYHQNDKDEWLRYGAGAYLKNCRGAVVRNCRITQNQNALLMSGCTDGLVYNNVFHFNSGLGIGLYRSSRNRILHNKLDWNVRGYSHNIYQRGQDSAGILCYEQSHENTFAFNSATHSGDGFFLWAGQTTMDDGTGGCNDNLIYDNDFSHAPTNGIEVTFSSNRLIGNRLEECRYGVWGGYSWQTDIIGNIIRDCHYGVAVEHGQENTIQYNLFENDTIGIRLWEREQQPADWGYARQRDVSSRDYDISGNLFVAVSRPLDIADTAPGSLVDNGFYRSPFRASGLGDGWKEADNYIGREVRPPDLPKLAALVPEGLPEPLPDGIDAGLPADHPRGRRYILVNEWGPYNFAYPSVWLRDIQGDEYIFLLLGPPGNWKVTGGEGLLSIVPKTGTFPATVRARREADSPALVLHFEFIGEAFTDQFGQDNRRGKPYPFSFSRFEPAQEWTVRWYDYDENLDPLTDTAAFRQLGERQPLHEEKVNTLAYRLWRAPHESVPADRFATFAQTEIDVPPGRYRLTLTSDDGLRLYLDDELIIDNWSIHEATVDTLEIELSGRHQLSIEHFDAGGMATLDFQMEKIGTPLQ